jgi:excisionase family DNA binding protein
MASDLLSLADASELLGVSSERVRQLVVAGDLPGVRFGNAWAVPRDSIDARRQVSNRRGRPLSARRAWEEVAAGDVDLSNVSRYRNRGEVHRYEMSAADLEFVSRHEGSMVSGVAAAVGLGEQLQAVPGAADLYVSASAHGLLGSLVAAVPDQLGGIALRVVPDEAWVFVEAVSSGKDEAGHRLAPRAAVALDLMESGDPRHWVAAENLIEARG